MRDEAELGGGRRRNNPKEKVSGEQLWTHKRRELIVLVHLEDNSCPDLRDHCTGS